jgi:cbb3-type cytochrome oxidase subunit 1
MKSLPFYFIAAAIVFALAGMGFGMYMAASQDHLLAGAHAHNNLLGWVMMAIFGLYYKAVPAAVGRLANAHFWLTLVANLVFPYGIGLAILGGTPAIAAIGGGLEILSMLIFGWIVVHNRAGLSV